MTLWRIAFHQQQALDLIAIHLLQYAANAQNYFRRRHGFNIANQNSAIAKLHGVMRECSQFIADASAGGIVLANLQREFPWIEPFFAELQSVFAWGDAH